MIPVVLCADDYGFTPAVSEGILELIDAGRLSAVSCMTTVDHWPAAARALHPFRDRIDVGVHLTLTGLAPLGSMPKLAPQGTLPAPGALIKASFLGGLDQDEIGAELHRQLDAFEEHFGAPPDFLDGHHHVQHLAGVRDAVIELYQQRLADSGAWIRVGSESPGTVFKRGVAVVKALAASILASPLRTRLRRTSIPHNHGFSGLYDLSGAVPYRDLFRRFLLHSKPGALIMCHPGRVDDALRRADTLTDQRERELEYFKSETCLADWTASGCRLSRMPEATHK